MSSVQALWQKHRQFLLYCICGGTGVCTDYAVFLLLFQVAGLGHQAANAAGYLAGTMMSFVLNRAITFNMRDQTGKRLALFLTTAGIGFLASAALLALLVDVLHVDARLAKILTLPMVVVLQFTLNKRFTFQAKAS
jgi:putative flippase GtrA